MGYPWTQRTHLVLMVTGNARLIIVVLMALAFLAQSLQAAAAWCMLPVPEPVSAAIESPAPCHGEAAEAATPDASQPAPGPMDCCATDNCAMTGCMSSPPAFAALEFSFTAALSHVHNASHPEARLSVRPASLFRPPTLR